VREVLPQVSMLSLRFPGWGRLLGTRPCFIESRSRSQGSHLAWSGDLPVEAPGERPWRSGVASAPCRGRDRVELAGWIARSKWIASSAF